MIPEAQFCRNTETRTRITLSPATHLDVLLQHAYGSGDECVPHLRCLLGVQVASVKLIHWLDAKCTGLVVLQELLKPRIGLLPGFDSLQEPCCTRAGSLLLSLLPIYMVCLLVFFAMHLLQLRILQVPDCVVSACGSWMLRMVAGTPGAVAAAVVNRGA